ncbi:MAG: hypothetical protein K0Q72_1398 [Armatimonadetes bacterium]|nr:hypothetical protein [Armatimonadota bacterium]
MAAALNGADLTSANLRGANLCLATLSMARLNAVDLHGARYDASTRWPDGFDPAAHGAVLVR